MKNEKYTDPLMSDKLTVGFFCKVRENKMQTQMSEEKLERIKQLLLELDSKSFDQAVIQDNKIIFPYENGLYRCKMPSQKIQSICEDDKNKYQIGLLEEGNYKTFNG